MKKQITRKYHWKVEVMKRLIIRNAAVMLLTLFSMQGFAAQSLTAVSSSELDGGVVQIIVEGTEPFATKPASFSVDTPPRIIVDVEGASGLDKKTFPIGKSGVDSLVIVEANGRSRLVARLQEKKSYDVQANNNQLVITIGETATSPATAAVATSGSTASAAAPDAGKLSLNFQDIEVRSVLQLLADFTGLNMVVSDTVQGNVTLRLKDVHWQQALDIILKTKSLAMRQEDNIIMVAPASDIAAQEQQEAEAASRLQELKPLRSDLVRIKYAKASDLSSLMQAETNRLLSDRGSVTVDNRTNTLLLRDTEDSIREIKSLIAKLDRPTRQVMIESRIVIANDLFAKDLGVRLGWNAARGNDTIVALGGGYESTLQLSDEAAGNIITGPEGNTTYNVNLPANSAAVEGGILNMVIGRLGSNILELELSAMQQEGKGEVISSPRVVTSDQNKAIIKQGFEVPYLENTSSGATNIEFKEAVLKLEVTPQITPDNKVFMDLAVNKDFPDYTNALLGQPPINTKEVTTKVLVADGETVVLGGIFEKDELKSQDKVPVLGDVPGIGRLFRRDTRQSNKTELMVFVTPKILRR